jgi:hypothetical protein
MDFVFKWQGESDADKRYFEGLVRIVAGYAPVDVQDEQVHSLKVVASPVVYILTDRLSEERDAQVSEPTQLETGQVLRRMGPVRQHQGKFLSSDQNRRGTLYHCTASSLSSLMFDP